MIKELITIFDKAYRFKVDYKLNTQLHNIAIKHLGLDNMNQLRDRYEGQAYLDRFLTKSYSEFAVQKMLGIDFVSLDLKASKSYKPVLVYNGKNYEIIGSSLEEYPLIPKGEYDYAMLSFVNLGRREVYVVGYCSYKNLLKLIDSADLSPTKSRSYIGNLKDFSKIQLLDQLLIEDEQI